MVIVISIIIFDAIIITMSDTKQKEKSSCIQVKVTLCNGALKAVEALQEKYFNDHNGIFLSKPRAINILLSGIEMEKKCKYE